MNHNTRRSIAELFRCIDRMNKAFSTSLRAEANATEDNPKESFHAYHEFCRTMGAVIAQTSIVQIDLDIYEKEADELSKAV